MKIWTQCSISSDFLLFLFVAAAIQTESVCGCYLATSVGILRPSWRGCFAKVYDKNECIREMEKEQNKSISARLRHCDAGPILSRSLCCNDEEMQQAGMTSLLLKGPSALVRSGFCFRAARPYLTRLYVGLFKSKRPSQTCYVSAQTHTHTDWRTDRQSDGRTHAWGRGVREKAWVLLVISSRYTNTKDFCVRRRASRSAQFLFGSRPHSLQFYGSSPLRSSLCAAFLPPG